MFEPKRNSQKEENELYKITCKWKNQNGDVFTFYDF